MVLKSPRSWSHLFPMDTCLNREWVTSCNSYHMGLKCQSISMSFFDMWSAKNSHNEVCYVGGSWSWISRYVKPLCRFYLEKDQDLWGTLDKFEIENLLERLDDIKLWLNECHIDAVIMLLALTLRNLWTLRYYNLARLTN